MNSVNDDTPAFKDATDFKYENCLDCIHHEDKYPNLDPCIACLETGDRPSFIHKRGVIVKQNYTAKYNETNIDNFVATESNNNRFMEDKCAFCTNVGTFSVKDNPCYTCKDHSNFKNAYMRQYQQEFPPREEAPITKSTFVHDLELKRIIEHYGSQAQCIQTMQELGELIVALTKNDRAKILEELADVHLMAKQLKIIYQFTEEEIKNSIRFKVDRTLDRMKAGGRTI